MAALLAPCTSFRTDPEGGLRSLRPMKVIIISKLECSEVLKVVLGAMGTLQTEASKTRMKAWRGGSRGFTTYYAALVSNQRQDLCAVGSAGLGAQGGSPEAHRDWGLLWQDRYSALCDGVVICMGSAQLIIVTGARSCWSGTAGT